MMLNILALRTGVYESMTFLQDNSVNIFLVARYRFVLKGFVQSKEIQ